MELGWVSWGLPIIWKRKPMRTNFQRWLCPTPSGRPLKNKLEMWKERERLLRASGGRGKHLGSSSQILGIIPPRGMKRIGSFPSFTNHSVPEQGATQACQEHFQEHKNRMAMANRQPASLPALLGSQPACRHDCLPACLPSRCTLEPHLRSFVLHLGYSELFPIMFPSRVPLKTARNIFGNTKFARRWPTA